MPVVHVVQPSSILRDSAAAAQARVRLKLSALAYAGIRCGPDASPDLVGASLAQIAGCAVAYYQALGGQLVLPDSIMPTPEAGQRLAQLQLAAVAYSCSRHGADACVEFSRDALHVYCNAAIAYCQALPGADTEARIVDAGLTLERG